MFKASTFLLLFSFAFTPLKAQVPRFAKYPINQTGHFAYFPSDPGAFDVSKSDDGADVYTAEVEFDSSFYGMIVVDFVPGTMDGSTKEDMEELLVGYLDFLQQQFMITESAGYGRGHTLESNPNAVGVIDYWADETGFEYKVKGWADTKTLAVLYIGGKEPVFNVQEMYLNGFLFN
ncbi:MAG: hypothetical protein POELPBGB_03875 [Bacteroidia bacterium]|nr:hypothetical protein [Bacteroidia bacterium]